MKEDIEYTLRYREALKRLFNTPDGELVLNDWKSAYIETSCLMTTSEKTHYCLGQKDLIQEFINNINKDIEVIEDQPDEDILDE